jgi:hypothetical protein
MINNKSGSGHKMDDLQPGELVLANVSFKYKVITRTTRGFKEVTKDMNEMVFSRQYVSTYPKLEKETDYLILSKLSGSKITKRNHKVNEIYDVEVVKMDVIVRTGFINKR